MATTLAMVQVAQITAEVHVYIHRLFLLPASNSHLGPNTRTPDFFPASPQNIVLMLAVAGDPAFCRGVLLRACIPGTKCTSCGLDR